MELSKRQQTMKLIDFRSLFLLFLHSLVLSIERHREPEKCVDDEVCVIVVKVMEGVVNVDDDDGRKGNENTMMTMSPIFPLRRDKSSFFAKCLQILIRFNHLYCQACESCVTVSVSSSVPIVVCDASERIECA